MSFCKEALRKIVDLRNTLCGRLKLQKTQKTKITLSQIQSNQFFKLNFPSFDEIVTVKFY